MTPRKNKVEMTIPVHNDNDNNNTCSPSSRHGQGFPPRKRGSSHKEILAGPPMLSMLLYIYASVEGQMSVIHSKSG